MFVLKSLHYFIPFCITKKQPVRNLSTFEIKYERKILKKSFAQKLTKKIPHRNIIWEINENTLEKSSNLYVSLLRIFSNSCGE